MENSEVNTENQEQKEQKERRGLIMRNVAHTFAHNKQAVKDLIKEVEPEIGEDANRGTWISALMKHLKDDDDREFRVSFAEIMIEKKSIGQKIRERVRENIGGGMGSAEKRVERSKIVEAQREGRGKDQGNFYSFEGQQLPDNPEQLADELRVAANSTTDKTFETLVNNSEQKKNSTNVLLIGGVLLASWFIYKKFIK